MKKFEAEQIAPDRSRLLLEYITQILADNQHVEALIRINSAKINNQKMVTFEIIVPQSNFERYLNTGIPVQHVDVLTQHIFDDIIECVINNNNLRVSPFYTHRDSFANIKDGIDMISDNGNMLKISFPCHGQNFRAQVDDYNWNFEEEPDEEKTLGK